QPKTSRRLRITIPMQPRFPQASAPIPGTALPPRGLFISRHGALLERPVDGVYRRFEDARFTPRSLELLFRAGQAGWKVYVVGNEEGVARGKVSEAAWERFEAGLVGHLAGQGIVLARHYACLDHP